MAEQHPQGDFYKATPVAQKMAADLGINLDTIQGSGDHGKITKEDVQRASSANGGSPAAAKIEPVPKAAPVAKPAPAPTAATPAPVAPEPAAKPAPTPADDVLESTPLKASEKSSPGA